MTWDGKQWIEEGVEWMLRSLFFWVNDPHQLATYIQHLHSGIFLSMSVIYILLQIHWIPSPYDGWIFWTFYAVYLIVWIHHVVCEGCSITFIEERLFCDARTLPHMLVPVFSLFGLPTEDPVLSNRVFVLFSTCVLIHLTLEGIGRCVR